MTVHRELDGVDVVKIFQVDLLLDHLLFHEVNDDVLGQRRGLIGQLAIGSTFSTATQSLLVSSPGASAQQGWSGCCQR
jgi:hypothetical protein